MGCASPESEAHMLLFICYLCYALIGPVCSKWVITNIISLLFHYTTYSRVISTSVTRSGIRVSLGRSTTTTASVRSTVTTSITVRTAEGSPLRSRFISGLTSVVATVPPLPLATRTLWVMGLRQQNPKLLGETFSYFATFVGVPDECWWHCDISVGSRWVFDET